MLQLLAFLALATASGHATFSQLPSINNPEDVCTISLNLSDIPLPSIRRDFIVSEHIKQLILQRDQILEIKEGAFEALPNLMILDLSHNKLAAEDLFSCGPVSSLQALILDDNYSLKTKVTTAIVKYLYPRLEYLSLRKCRLETISTNWAKQLPSLTHLDLSENWLNITEVTTYLPGTISHLYAEMSGITQFCSRRLANLETLDLDGNRFEAVAGTGACQANTLDLSFERVINLQELSLSGCNIKRIDETAFYYVSKLKILNLQRNEFASLSAKALEKLSVLQQLDISQNALKQVPDFSVLQQLETLSMNEMRYTQIFQRVETTRWKISKLKVLSLQGNGLTSLSPGMFEGLESLETLNLSRNKITTLKITWQAVHLKVLSLQDNAITDLDQVSLDNAKLLQALDIRGNQITRFTASVFHRLPANATIEYRPVCD